VRKTPQAFGHDRVSTSELAAYVEQHVKDTESVLLERMEQLAAILKSKPTNAKTAQVILALASLKANLKLVDLLRERAEDLSSMWKAYRWWQRWANEIETRDTLKLFLEQSHKVRAKCEELKKAFIS